MPRRNHPRHPRLYVVDGISGKPKKRKRPRAWRRYERGPTARTSLHERRRLDEAA